MRVLYGCYSHSIVQPSFHRRSYWLIPNSNFVLVHYLDTKGLGTPQEVHPQAPGSSRQGAARQRPPRSRHRAPASTHATQPAAHGAEWREACPPMALTPAPETHRPQPARGSGLMASGPPAPSAQAGGISGGSRFRYPAWPPAVGPMALIDIADYSPKWSLCNGGVRVAVCLLAPVAVPSAALACSFDGICVPVELVQPAVLRCTAPGAPWRRASASCSQPLTGSRRHCVAHAKGTVNLSICLQEQRLSRPVVFDYQSDPPLPSARDWFAVDGASCVRVPICSVYGSCNAAACVVKQRHKCCCTRWKTCGSWNGTCCHPTLTGLRRLAWSTAPRRTIRGSKRGVRTWLPMLSRLPTRFATSPSASTASCNWMTRTLRRLRSARCQRP